MHGCIRFKTRKQTDANTPFADSRIPIHLPKARGRGDDFCTPIQLGRSQPLYLPVQSGRYASGQGKSGEYRTQSTGDYNPTTERRNATL